jgi:hypothetical protein
MLTLSAKIKVSNNNEDTAISGLDTNHSAVYYASPIAEVLNKSVDEPTPFVLGSTALGSGAAFGKGKVGFYIGDEKSDVNGVFEDAYALYFKGTNLSSVCVEFDTQTTQYAKRIELYEGMGETWLAEWVNDDANFVAFYQFKDNQQYHFRFYDWSAPKSHLVIRGVRAGDSEIIVDKRNAISINCKFMEKADVDMPSFGLFSNSGSIEFKDIDGEYLELIQQRAFTQGSQIEIVIEDTLHKTSEGERVFPAFATITDLEYDVENRTIQASFSDGLTEFQEMPFIGIFADLENYKSTNLLSMLLYLRGIVNVYVADPETEAHLKNIFVAFPIIEKSSVWEALTKICVAGQCYIFADKKSVNKQYLIKYNGGK